MKKVFLYAGQGSQKVGMGKDFMEEYPVFREEMERLDPSGIYSSLMMEGPMETLTQTNNTQVCMSLFAACLTKLLMDQGVEAVASCGLSLGEYGALHAAGVYDDKTYIRLVTLRGQAMHEAANGLECAMSAVLGLKKEEIEPILEEIKEGYVVATNFNCPGQIVICGDLLAVEAAKELLLEKGAKRVIPLNVGGPFHTKYMKAAGIALESFFKRIGFQQPNVPVALNVTGKLWTGEENIRELLVQQVQTGVQMEEDLKSLLEAGYRDYIEIGPGNTMAGFLKKTAKEMGIEVSVMSIENTSDYRKVVCHE